MKKRVKELEYYVKNYNFNKKQLEDFNIFQNSKFIEGVEEALTLYYDNECSFYEQFKKDIQKELQYCFWSKREYEIFVGDAFEEDISKYTKIDVYSQVLPNLDILCNYIINNCDFNFIFEKN